MTDIDNLRALYEKATPGEWGFGGWGIAAGDELVATTHFSEGRSFVDDLRLNTANGTAIAALHNAFPALASELEAARKVVAEHRWRHDDEECVCKPAEMGFDGIKDARLCSVAEYLRVMEEQR